MVSINSTQFQTLNSTLLSQIQNNTQSAAGGVFDGYFNQGAGTQITQQSIPLIILSAVLNVLGLGNLIPTDATNNVQQTATNQKIADTSAIDEAKQGCASDLAAFKNAGVTVSDWDNNNTCTLSFKGKTASITIDNSGNPQFSGDIEFMMEHLKSNNPAQKASVEKQNQFLQEMEQKGNPVVGDAKMTSIKVNGKDTEVNEYTTQNGDKYYLNDEGNKVTPDN